MAPRGSRGGSHGGGGSYGDEGSSSVWLQTVQLSGNNFADGYVTASIVFEIICFVILFALCIWWFLYTKKHTFKPKVLGATFKTALVLMTASDFLLSLNDLLYQTGATVARIYILVPILEFFTGYAATIIVLIVIFKVLANFFGGAESSTGKILVICSYVVGLVLAALQVAAMYFQISYLVNITDALDFGIHSSPYNKILAAFNIVVLMTALLLLVASCYNTMTSHTRTSNPKPSQLLLFCVAIPLLVSSITTAAIYIQFNLLQKFGNVDTTYLVSTLLGMIPGTIVFVGLALVGYFSDGVRYQDTEAAIATSATAVTGSIDPRFTGASTRYSQQSSQQPTQQQQWAHQNGLPQQGSGPIPAQQWGYPVHGNGIPAQYQPNANPVQPMPQQQGWTSYPPVQQIYSQPSHELPGGQQQQYPTV